MVTGQTWATVHKGDTVGVTKPPNRWLTAETYAGRKFMAKHDMTRRGFLGATAAAALMGLPARPARGVDATVSRRQPNVLFINTDQQRKDTLHCYGNRQVETPHLDALAARGTLFTSCYVTQPVCSPCRSSMVTGLFPNATTVVENNCPLPATLLAWPRELRAAGYRTAYIGKWHLGVDPVPDYFDVWRGFHTGWKHFIKEEPFYAEPGQMDSAFRKAIAEAPPTVPEGKSLVGKYRPDVETDYAIEFIRASRDRPFACWLSFYPPHTPKEAPKENIALYEDTIQPHEQAVYHAMVNRLDWNLGRLIAALDDLGLRDNTLIVFTSDHGENFPLQWNQHLKRLCYDQSANVPLIVSGPGTLSEGRRIDDVVSIADLCPTILDMCGLAVPSGLHGRTLRGLLEGTGADWPGEAYIQNKPYTENTGAAGEGETSGKDPDMRERCMVTRDWKLIQNTTRPPELYRRDSAQPDTENLFGQAHTRATALELMERIGAWATKTGDEIGTRLVNQWAGHVRSA